MVPDIAEGDPRDEERDLDQDRIGELAAQQQKDRVDLRRRAEETGKKSIADGGC